jgi:hypothetical protein
MSRVYTAEQIADLIDLICSDPESGHSEETKEALRGVAGYLLKHSQKSYDDLRQEVKEQQMISSRKKYPPFHEGLIDEDLKSQVV